MKLDKAWSKNIFISKYQNIEILLTPWTRYRRQPLNAYNLLPCYTCNVATQMSNYYVCCSNPASYVNQLVEKTYLLIKLRRILTFII